MKILISIIVLVLGSIAAVVISKPALLGLGIEPLASLSEPALSGEYTSAFWAKEHADKSDLWARAIQFCAKPSAEPRPNCAIVTVIADNSAQERLAREELAERSRVRQWLRADESAEIPDGLTGHGAKAVPSGFGRPQTGAQGSAKSPR